MSNQRRTLIERRTTLSPAEVLAAGKAFFARRHSIYSLFIEQESPTHVSLRGQGGEELVLSARTAGDATEVTGGSYMFDAQLNRFFSTLPATPESVS